MESQMLITFSYNGGNGFVLNMPMSSSFLDFNFKLIEKGVVPRVGSTRFHYKVYSTPHNCSLNTEDDWKNMVLLMKATGVTVTTIQADVMEALEGSCLDVVAVVNPTTSIPHSALATNVVGRDPGYNTILANYRTYEAFEESRAALMELDEQDDSSTDDEAPLLSLAWKSNKRPLLSDSWSNLITSVGQVFKGGVSEFRIALAKFSCEVGFKFRYVRNIKTRIHAVCEKHTSHGCQWFIKASVTRVNGWFNIIKMENIHTCPLSVQTNKRMGSVLMSLLIVDKIRADPSTSPTNIVEHFVEDYGMEVNYDMAWRAVERARSMIFGNYTESFQELSWFVSALERANPGTKATLEVNPDNRFHRLFVAFGASISGFKNCRPMLFIDGTFLTSRFQGCMLSAVAKDGNQGIYPLAFAIVDSENKENWSWFLGILQEITGNERELLYLSDRNPGLMEVFAKEYPHLHHYYCLHHLKCNLRSRFSGKGISNAFREKLVNTFRDCARAPTIHMFDQKLAELIKMGGTLVEEFLSEIPYEKWAHAHSPMMRYGEMTSNAAESFNKWILEARSLPITHMINTIRIKMMKMFYKRRTEAAKWVGLLCGDKQKTWDSSVKEARQWNGSRSSETVFEFFSNPPVHVDIAAKFCSCYGWQFHGFPCSHAIAAVSRSNIGISEIVDPHYFTSAFRKCYEGLIIPVSPTMRITEDVESGDIILPPETKRKPGRPKKVRIRSIGEKIRAIRCSRCKKLGRHNRKSCRRPISS